MTSALFVPPSVASSSPQAAAVAETATARPTSPAASRNVRFTVCFSLSCGSESGSENNEPGWRRGHIERYAGEPPPRRDGRESPALRGREADPRDQQGEAADGRQRHVRAGGGLPVTVAAVRHVVVVR